MTRKDAERQEAIENLREWLKPGDTVYTVLRHVSRSGMQREIGTVLLSDGTDLHPNYAVSKATGYRQGKTDGVVIGGCGMDMGFQLVYQLGSVLWPEGFGCIGEKCPSNDHSNGDRDHTPHSCRGSEDAGFGHSHGDTGTVSGPTIKDTLAKLNPPRVCHWHRSGGYALKQRWL